MAKTIRHKNDAGAIRIRGVRTRRTKAAAFLVLALLAFPPTRNASAAILLDAASSAIGVNKTTLTWSHTVGTGTDRVLLVGVSVRQGNRAVTQVTYAGLPLTLVGSRIDPLNVVRVSLFVLAAPPSGTATVSVTVNNQANLTGGAASFTGVYQAGPVAGFASAGGSSAVASVTIPGAPGEVVVGTVAVQQNAGAAAPGGGQALLWSAATGNGGNDVRGGGSAAPGASSVTMSWSFSAARPWVILAARLRPVMVLPDAMIKTSSEGAGAFASDNVYENPAALQAKSQAVMSGATAVYDVRFGNDGNTTGAIRITGTAGGGGFSVQYLDETGADRTAAVTGGGYVIPGLAPGAGATWTLRVGPSGMPAPVPGGTSYDVFVTAASVADPALSDQVRATTSSSSASLTLLKSADKGSAKPGDDVAYQVVASNGAGLTNASAIDVTEPVPANTGFKVGSASFAPGTSTLTSTASYSNDGGGTWTYAPAGGGCSAPPGYDDCVTHVRWTMAGSMPPGTSFTVGLVVRVK